MPKDRKARTVDGYAALKAAQRAVKSKKEPAAAHPAPAGTPVAPPSTDLKKLGAHVAHTVVPAKQVIECYECGYKFQLHGRADHTNCSKCRALLNLADLVIDGKWKKSFRTAGTIRFTANGVLEGGHLLANDIVLEGIIAVGTIRAMHKLELRPGAQFPETSITSPDLVVAAGTAIVFAEPAEYRDVEVFGTLRAKLNATGAITVRAGGLIDGEVAGEHLVVEEGGGLTAALHIGPRSGTKPKRR